MKRITNQCSFIGITAAVNNDALAIGNGNKKEVIDRIRRKLRTIKVIFRRFVIQG
jgi:hypothetical protein